ncbi:MAG: hypothetical protein E5X53_28235 [Mesorhizobium sp.]|uniref:LexA family protein n=1 Tax=Mesorhizobium sp. TaxID=1871066 RepID=UPI0012117BFB|nr:hypothetical protein [Mesorhizobium sp.]TIP70346.1 MAG: hypothetical protein E5X55_27915 [Mesorhizobium sp.]TIQ06743.1 MAG: hypothetical protein E5X57_24135 [Mesorhizobium sp.]TIR48616.1 MAG: hypothetical protein E5X53_28235 [Mesorhizobium sp.]TJV94695.1 MAG: hypothetical protein E5X52_27900 [Mesorhizobium sp.]
MNTLTSRQSDMMSFIQSFQAERGFGPSYREIAEALDLRSVGNVHRMVSELEGRGVLRKPHNEARSFEIIGEQGAEHHLKAILAEIGRAGAVHQDSLCVVDAMRFLGRRDA